MTDEAGYIVKAILISPLDLEKNGGDVGHLLVRELGARIGFDPEWSMSPGRLTQGGIEIKVTSSLLRTWLEFAVTDRGFVPLVVGNEADAIDEEFSLWEQAAKSVSELIMTNAPERRWNGIVGPLPRQRFRRPWRMTTFADCGHMTLFAASTYMVEGMPGDHRWGLSINTSEGSWPIIIHGTSRVYDDHRLTTIAFKDMTTVCCLLSLALAEPWVPRGHPWDESFHRWGVSAKPEGTPEWIDPPDPTPQTTFSLEDWLPTAWRRTQDPSAEHLHNAIWAFREGLLLIEQHPSLALVAFTSALETLAFAKYSDEGVRCGECGQIKGTTSRFRRLLRQHLGKKRAKWFVDFYDRRSKTVHAAVFHGSELSAGWQGISNYFSSEVMARSAFEGDLSWNFQRITRQIILKEMDLGVACVDPWASE